MYFQSKTVWITGASSGIGEALALAFAREKSNLILSARNETKLTEVKNKCEQLGSDCSVYMLDLTDEKGIISTAQKVIKNHKHIDVLINNGGISQRSQVIETSIDVDRKVMETNFFGAVTLTKQVLPVMVSQGGGQVATVSSIVGKFGFPLRSAYSASKHALHGFFETVRAELKGSNIKVSIIIPGRIRTNISINAVGKNGEKYGIMDAGQDKGMDAEICAKKIIEGLKKGKKEILVGGKELVMVHIRRFLPSLYYKLVSKVKPT